MDTENIREYDEIYSDRLINYSNNIEDSICKDVKNQVLLDIIPLTPDDADTMDELFIKKMQLEEEIYPRLFNFHIKCVEYDNVYMDICERMENFTKAQKELEDIPDTKENNSTKNLRENRLKFYMKK